MKFNPFRPNSIVNSGMFAGRYSEMKALDQALFQIKHGNPWHFLIHGERGIGKSSLMHLVDVVACGQVPVMIEDDLRMNFITVNVAIEPSTTYADLIDKIGLEFARSLSAKEVMKSKLKNIWDFVSRWEVCGVSYDRTQSPSKNSDVLEQLAETFVAACDNIGDSADGVLILIDEADKGDRANLGEFVKLFTERLTRRNCGKVGIGVSGISTVLKLLKESHESSVRILNHMLLEPLLQVERIAVIEKGLAVANAKNPTRPTMIDDDAKEFIATSSDGYPHFIQQYAYSAFDTDVDGTITIQDAKMGAYSENGALDQLGARYFEDMYLDQINSPDYRKVLQALADSSDEYATRKYIQETAGLRDTTLQNALKALTRKRIILKHREKPGLYKLPSSSFAAWIRAWAKKRAEGGTDTITIDQA